MGTTPLTLILSNIKKKKNSNIYYFFLFLLISSHRHILKFTVVQGAKVETLDRSVTAICTREILRKSQVVSRGNSQTQASTRQVSALSGSMIDILNFIKTSMIVARDKYPTIAPQLREGVINQYRKNEIDPLIYVQRKLSHLQSVTRDAWSINSSKFERQKFAFFTISKLYRILCT